MRTSLHAGLLSATAAWPAWEKLLAASADMVVAQWPPASLSQQTITAALVLRPCSGLEAAEHDESYSKTKPLPGASICLQETLSAGKNSEGYIEKD